ncbi:hypothetical protein VTN49DRAFT_2869 [Thermomyces lanuginosus]|uniref:uncharacterized protein n=1 Tax=Thermomyces lanuginosus TaxID=5541 RepID=UPI003743A260
MDSSPGSTSLSPTKGPLFPATPERINQQKIAASPSIFSDDKRSPGKQSDVQAKIAMLNNLSRQGSSTGGTAASQNHKPASASSAAALQRAILGREEAEAALAAAKAELEDAKDRERRLSQRLESLVEELQATKQRQAHERSLFEKEVRKARKEAFRSSSSLVKAQEELKLCKAEIKSLKEEIRSERDSKEKAKQEAFERAYALAGLTEELHGLKDQLKSFEAAARSGSWQAHTVHMNQEDSDRNLSPREEDATRNRSSRRPKRSADAIELRSSAFRESVHEDETPPKKARLSCLASDKESEDPEAEEDQRDLIEQLRAEIRWEQRQRRRAEDMIQFMKMECQFKRCSCRIAEEQGYDYVHDREWAEAHPQHQTDPNMENEDSEPHDMPEEDSAESAHSPVGSPASARTPPTPHERDDRQMARPAKASRESIVTFCPETGTFKTVPSPPHLDVHHDLLERSHAGPLVLPNADVPEEISAENARSSTPEGYPQSHYIDIPSTRPRQIIESSFGHHDESAPSTTNEENIFEDRPCSRRSAMTPVEDYPGTTDRPIIQTVPLRTEDHQSRDPSAKIPGTPVTREEALAQIRARRGRARTMVKRSASANAAPPIRTGGGMNVPPIRGTQRIPGVRVGSETKSEPDVHFGGDRRKDVPPHASARRH